MQIVSGYSMLASAVTTMMLSIIFLILSHQSGKNYMRLWGSAWLIYSAMFLLDFWNLSGPLMEISYIMFRQMIALLGSYLFLLGTYRFFQMRFPRYFHLGAVLFTLIIVLYPASWRLYTLAVIPNVIFCSGMLIAAGCMFISISWTQKLPEKLIASFLIISWSIFINHFGFTLRGSTLAIAAYFIGLLTVNLLMLTLIIIYFKKLRFIDTRRSARFRLLVENSSDSMFLYDYKTRRFEYISPAISELVGVAHRKLYDMPERFFDHVDIEEKNRQIINLFSRPVSQPGNGVLCLYKNGTVEKWSEIHYLPIRDNTGTVSAVEGILRDITQRRKMEQELKAASDAKKELLENISHEIKTPVTLIQGYTESLLDKVVPAESTDTYLKMIHSKAMMLTTLLDDLSQASNVASQSMEYKFYEHRATEMFGELLNQSKFHISSSGHQAVVTANIHPDAVLIADPYRIQQVISNMISNAIRHTPAGGQISVSCTTWPNEELMHSAVNEDDYNVPEGELVFAISDRGDGIPEEHLPHVFERNFSGGRRIDPAGSAGSAGALSPSRSGLGLYISKQIITQHSGRMLAKNNKYGGAEISFTLPYYK